MRGFRRKPTEENSQERISGQELTSSCPEIAVLLRPREFLLSSYYVRLAFSFGKGYVRSAYAVGMGQGKILPALSQTSRDALGEVRQNSVRATSLQTQQ